MSSKTNPTRDWYFLKLPKQINDAETSEPPNNRSQILGEVNSVWRYDLTTEGFYLTLSTPE